MTSNSTQASKESEGEGELKVLRPSFWFLLEPSILRIPFVTHDGEAPYPRDGIKESV